MTGHPVGYGFISFENEETAQRVLREMNGQQIPNAAAGKKFRLNNTSTRDTDAKESEYSIYVGDLSPEVDDYILLAAFSAQYPSTCSAKVMIKNGQSKGYGFVRFTNESDYRSALHNCQNSHIVGSKPISVRAANPRKYRRVVETHINPYTPTLPPAQPLDNNNDMNPYYSNYGLVNPYLYYGYTIAPVNGVQYSYDPYVYGQQYFAQPYYSMADNYAYPLMASHTYVDHGHNSHIIDADKLNEEMIAKNEDLYASIENSRWSSGVECDNETKGAIN